MVTSKNRAERVCRADMQQAQVNSERYFSWREACECARLSGGVAPKMKFTSKCRIRMGMLWS